MAPKEKKAPISQSKREVIKEEEELDIDMDLILKKSEGLERRQTEMMKFMRSQDINPKMMSKKAESKMLESLQEVFGEDEDMDDETKQVFEAVQSIRQPMKVKPDKTIKSQMQLKQKEEFPKK